MSKPPELSTIFLIFGFITFLLMLAVMVIALVSAKLQGEKISLLRIPALFIKGLKVWMGVALDNQAVNGSNPVIDTKSDLNNLDNTHKNK